MKKGRRPAAQLTSLTLTGVLLAGSAHAQTDNTATGSQALISNTTGDYNTATGAVSLRYNTSGSSNTATGRGALYKNTSGQYNTATGAGALYWNTTTNDNTAMGFEALVSNVSSENTAVGFQALFATTTGGGNTGVGSTSLWQNTSGYDNTAIGFNALAGNTTGYANVAIGSGALNSNNGNNNVAVGTLSGAIGSLNNTGAFGDGVHPSASNTTVIGNAQTISIGGPVAWSNLSDARFKTKVKENVPGLEFITKLRPITFHWDLKKLDAFNGQDAHPLNEAMVAARDAKEQKVYTGFLAQDVEAAARQCGFDFSGVVKPANEKSQYQLSYAEFVVPLVKAMQEQQKEVEELRRTVQRLVSRGQSAGEQDGSLMNKLSGGAIGIMGTLLALLYLKRSTAAA